MGEIINFPNTEKHIWQLEPERDEVWDSIIDEARRTGNALYEYDGKMYELKIEDLEPDDAA
jgi:hypothetical protein